MRIPLRNASRLRMRGAVGSPIPHRNPRLDTGVLIRDLSSGFRVLDGAIHGVRRLMAAALSEWRG